MAHLTNDAAVKSLLTHKCSCETHRLAAALRRTLEPHGVDLLIDPFGHGDDVERRIATLHGVDLCGLLFLVTPEAVASEYCQREIQMARDRWMPVFSARLGGDIPADHKHRTHVDAAGLDNAGVCERVEQLAPAMVTRGRIYRCVLMLPDLRPDRQLQEAQSLVEERDLTALAESVPHLAAQYCRVQDGAARYWIASAIGMTRTREAAAVLHRLQDCERDPYPLHAICVALKGMPTAW